MTGNLSDKTPEHHVTGSSELCSYEEKTSFLNYVDGEVRRTDVKQVKDASVTTKDKTKVIQRIKRDPVYRYKFLLSVWICISFIVLGMFAGQTGPAFPDLRLIVNEDLATSSWLLTAGTTGYLAGSLIFGVFYDKFNRLLLLFISIMGMSLASGIVPWCSVFPLMVTMRAISGAFAGGLDTGGNTVVAAIWGLEGRPYMQAVHFSFAFGGIISPLITEPFLAQRRTQMSEENQTQSTSAANLSHTNGLISCSNYTNCSALGYWGETKIQYAYTISTVFGILSAIPFLVTYLQKNSNLQTNKQQEANETSQRISTALSKCKKTGLIILLMLLFHLYCAVEDTFASYLMTFSLLHLNWTKLKGSLATAVYWASFGLGRFLGIFIIRLMHPTKMLFLYCSFLVISLASFLAGSILLFDPVVWIFSSLNGFAMSIIFPTIFSWTEENVMPVSGKIASLFLIAASSGTTINPLYLGYLMENKSPLWFPYLLLGQSILCFLAFVILYLCSKKCIKHKADVELEVECEQKEEEQENLNFNHV